ncbi:type II CAAX endopeptidase family protein [Bacteroides fluxus]|uniref:CPBP family intramembrane glutamic endopeptidase n=1 Tax=Bacteroides fluxus TaxID=626930 RepID=UPI002A826F23|nr:type II CAAX endopeptidase family protein [Bacteroides fluxus]MDY3789705.1 type II CAAX endopeptidase family protein [Bacteroides fluxus]
MKTAIKLVLIYFLMQLLGVLVAGPLCLAYTYLAEGVWNRGQAEAIALAPAMLMGFIFMGIYLWKNDYLTADRHLYSPVSSSYLAWSLAAGASSIFLIDALMSCLTFLPDWLSDTFSLLQTGWLGILCIAVFGPVLEELLFRGAITKVLLKRYSPGKAILASGLIFGLFHLNPVQVVGACFSGFLFAWIYYRTRSLIPGILIHILNNSLAVWLGLNFKEADTMAEVLGKPVYMIALAASVLLFFLSLKILNNYKLSDTNTTTITER